MRPHMLFIGWYDIIPLKVVLINYQLVQIQSKGGQASENILFKK